MEVGTTKKRVDPTSTLLQRRVYRKSEKCIQIFVHEYGLKVLHFFILNTGSGDYLVWKREGKTAKRYNHPYISFYSLLFFGYWYSNASIKSLVSFSLSTIHIVRDCVYLPN